MAWGLFQDNAFVKGVVLRLDKQDSLKCAQFVNSKHTRDCEYKHDKYLFNFFANDDSSIKKSTSPKQLYWLANGDECLFEGVVENDKITSGSLTVSKSGKLLFET